jgi:phosphoserine phosphatase
LSAFHVSSSRKIELNCLSGLTRSLLDEIGGQFYDRVVVSHFRRIVVERLREFAEQGYRIIVLSAALDTYLRFIRKSLPVDVVVSTELSYDSDQRCLGKVCGIDTCGIGKIAKLKNVFDGYKQIDFENSYFFTDDVICDRPVIDMVGHPVLVKDNNLTNMGLKR